MSRSYSGEGGGMFCVSWVDGVGLEDTARENTEVRRGVKVVPHQHVWDIRNKPRCSKK